MSTRGRNVLLGSIVMLAGLGARAEALDCSGIPAWNATANYPVGAKVTRTFVGGSANPGTTNNMGTVGATYAYRNTNGGRWGDDPVVGSNWSVWGALMADGNAIAGSGQSASPCGAATPTATTGRATATATATASATATTRARATSTTTATATSTVTATTRPRATSTATATATATTTSGSCSGLPAFTSCTAYALGVSVAYNGTKYTTIGTISATRDCPPSQPYNPSTDNWWRNDGACTGATATATATVPPRTTPTATATQLPAAGKVFVGYWENWQGDSGDTWIPLNNVNDKYNVLIVAFPTVLADGTVTMTGLEGSLNPTAADVALAHSRGKKVLISIGGALGSTSFSMTAQSQEDNFVNSIIGIVNTFAYDGIDIDIERNLDAPGPPDNPGGSVQHVINALNRLKDHYGSTFMLTFAPETANTVGAIGPCGSYGGIWGNYLPIFNALKSRITFVHMQYYNTAGMFGLDCNIYNLGTQDSISAWTEAMIEGFPIGRSGVQYTGLDPTQVVIGLPAWVQPGATYDAATTKAGWKCLTTGACGSGYHPRRTYPTLRGLMTWDVNIDKANNYGWIEPLYPCVMTGACN